MKFNCAYSKKNITLTIDPPFLYIVLNFQPISCYVTFIHFSFPIENYLKPGFQLIQASKVNVPPKKNTPLQHEGTISKVVTRRLLDRKASHAKLGNGHMKVASSHVNSLAAKAALHEFSQSILPS